MSIRMLRGLALLALAAVLTLVLQEWVGSTTIYGESYEPRRLAMHGYILNNTLPRGVSWDSLGSNGTNIRIGVVYIAEAAHELSGLPLLKVYHAIDSVALFVALILLFGFLRGWAGRSIATIGVLYVAAILPLTYFLYVFHPWDRVSLVLWLAMLALLRRGRLVPFAIVLAASVAVKYDTVLLPGLYFLAYASRRSWLRVSLTTAALFAVSFGMYAALRFTIPGGFASKDVLAQVSANLLTLRELHLRYPPLLGLAIPLALAALGWSRADRFARACVLFAGIIFVPLFIAAYFAEMRADVPLLLLLLPAACTGLEMVVGEPERVDRAAPSPGAA
ncbi:MAG: hypothetical protein WKG32_22640 [Gemmatimonadaceae bacterium]